MNFPCCAKLLSTRETADLFGCSFNKSCFVDQYDRGNYSNIKLNVSIPFSLHLKKGWKVTNYFFTVLNYIFNVSVLH